MGRPLPVDLVASSPVDVVDSPSADVASSYPVGVVASSPVDVIASSPADVIASSPADVIASSPTDVIASSSVNAVDSPSSAIYPVRVPVYHMFPPLSFREIAIYFARGCHAYDWRIVSDTELFFSWRDLKDVYSRNPQELEQYSGVTGVFSMRFGHDWGDEFYFEVSEGIIQSHLIGYQR